MTSHSPAHMALGVCARLSERQAHHNAPSNVQEVILAALLQPLSAPNGMG